MLGIEDPLVVAACLLSILSTLVCVIYSVLSWNRGDEAAREDDIRWAREEKRRDAEV